MLDGGGGGGGYAASRLSMTSGRSTGQFYSISSEVTRISIVDQQQPLDRSQSKDKVGVGRWVS